MDGLERDTLFVALTRPQMFAGVTYSYLHRQRGDRDRVVPDHPQSLWALRGRARRSMCVGVLLLPARAALLRPVAHQGQPLPARQESSAGAATATGPDPRQRGSVAREKPAGDRLPYARHVDDHTIETARRPADADASTCAACCSRPRTRGAQLSQAAARRDAAGDRLVALRALPPYHPPPGRGRARRPTIPTPSRAELDAAGGRGWRPSGCTSTSSS